MTAPRWLRILGTLGVATASCYLAYLVADFLVLEAPELLLAALTPIELKGFRLQPFLPQLLPQALTHAPPEASAALYALHRASWLLAGVALLGFGVWATARTRGWWRLFVTQSVFWAGALLVLYSGLFVGWRGALGAALSTFWPQLASSRPARLAAGATVAALALLATYLCVRRLLDSAAGGHLGRLLALLHWLLLPSLLVTALLITQAFSTRVLLRSSLTGMVLLWIAVQFLLVGLPAALQRARPAPAFAFTVRGAAALLVFFAVAFAALGARTELARYWRRQEFTQHSSAHWLLQFDLSARAQLDPVAFAATADERLAALARRLDLGQPPAGLRAYVYASSDTKMVVAGDDEPFTLDARRQEIHHLLAPAGGLTQARGDALLLMQTAWGDPGSEAVAQALARYAVGDFYGDSLEAYAARIAREEGPYSLRDIFQLDTDYLSPLVGDALGGAWVESLVRGRGPAILPVLYRERLAAGREEVFARALGTSWEQLERDWRSYLLALAERPAAPPGPPPAAFFHRGISFSHELGGGWGYGSDSARRELERIRQLGATAVAVVPYSFTRAPQETRIFVFTDESDARVIRTIEDARRLGLRVALKPQLWSHSFTGDIRFASEADFEKWFAHYRRWLLHCARLAELYQVDLLVIGTELGGVSRRAAAWRALIGDLRRIYRGPLTYAAHWQQEFDTLPFWDALDYLVVNFYFPLAAPGELPRPDSPRVQGLVEKFAAQARKHGKPVLFTEVGYPNTATAASEPWKEEGVEVDPEMQRRCYETVLGAFLQQPWLAGMYWWKWPSHGAGSPFEASYSPLGKPAAGVLARWYGQPGVRSQLASHPEGAILIQESKEAK